MILNGINLDTVMRLLAKQETEHTEKERELADKIAPKVDRMRTKGYTARSCSRFAQQEAMRLAIEAEGGNT